MAEKKLIDVEYSESYDSIFVNSGGKVKQIKKVDAVVDDALSEESINPVQNKVVAKKFKELSDEISKNEIVVTKSGSTIVATDSSEEAPEGLSVYGKSTQETTPGNQLLPNYRHETVTESGIIYTNNGDGTYTLNGTSTVYAQFIDTNSFILAAGTYNMSGGDAYTQIRSADGGTVLKTGNGSFTLEEETEVKFRQTVGTTNVTYANKLFSPMINKGTTSLLWEPYTNGASPNPEYPQAIESCENTEVGVYGANLASSIYCSEDASPYTKTLYAHADLKPSTVYTISFVGAKGNHFYGNEQMFSDYPVLICTGERQSITVKTLDTLDKTASRYNNTYGWILFKNHSSNTVVPKFTDVQIELGSTATPYKPYNKQSLTIPHTLCGIPVTDASLANYTDENGQMWCADEVDFERVVYIQRVGIEVHNTLSVKASTSSGRFIQNENIKNVYMSGTYPSMSNIAYYREWGTPFEDNRWAMCVSGNALYVSPPKESGYTFDTLNAYFAGKITADNPLIIVGILETPIETPLSTEEIEAYKSLKMNYPTTTILNNNGAGMKVSYVADTQNHIKHNYVPVSEFASLVNRVSALEKNAV